MPDRPWPYGTVIQVNDEFLVRFNGRFREEQSRRRMMVISDDGDVRIMAVALVTEYDNTDVHQASGTWWEPVE